MIKKLALIILLNFLLPFSVLAQDFNFNRAFSDYLYNFDLYRQAYQEYVSAKESFLQYKTLTSKTNAFQKTLKMTQARDETIRTYLIALKMKLGETWGISPAEKSVFNLRLDNEVNWYLTHKEELSSAGSLEDLVELANKAEERYQQETEILIYQTLHKILVGKENSLAEKVNNQIAALKEKLKEIKENGDKNVSLAERWLLETENRLLRFEEKMLASRGNMERMEKGFWGGGRGQIYKEAQWNLQEAHQYLKEANRYLKEIIREVKTADGKY
jgi:hypothetical protein